MPSVAEVEASLGAVLWAVEQTVRMHEDRPDGFTPPAGCRQCTKAGCEQYAWALRVQAWMHEPLAVTRSGE